MLNLFITYNCNFNCDYCFVRGFGKTYPMYLEEDKFEKLCAWLESNRIYFIGILGGEPTTHPRLIEMLDRLNQCGVAPVLFTNGLFSKALSRELAGRVANVVVNYNEPKQYGEKLWNKMQNNMVSLREQGVRLSLSKNFSKGAMEYQYILEGAKKYGISSIRYDISRPGPMQANNYFNLEESKAITKQILHFVRDSHSMGIRTGLDCCVPMCYFNVESLQYLQEVSMKFSGICHPSMDIQTDLSVSYCIPMQQVSVPDITKLHGELDLLEYFSSEVKALRSEKQKAGCETCDMFGKRCQGGCLALKKALVQAADMTAATII